MTDNHVISTGPTLEKSTLASGFSETDDDRDGDGIPDLAIGETMTYELVVTLPDTSMESVVLTDVLPAGLTFVSAGVTETGSEITIGTTSVSNSGQIVTISLANVVNTYRDNVITRAEDAVVIQVTARVADDPANINGRDLTNTASLVVTPEGQLPLDPVTDTATVEVVTPNVSVAKTVSDPSPDLGDTITYTFVVANGPDATAPAFNTVLTDSLPDGLTLTGVVSLSDPALGTVSPASINGSNSLVVTAPILQPGQSLIVTAEVFVGYTAPVLENVTNTAQITSGTTPIANDPNGRGFSQSDSAVVEPQPIPFGLDEPRGRAISGIDDAQFLPILLIDPIFTGTAEPGSNVTINLYRQSGALDYVRNIVADAGGHWIAIFPRVELNNITDDFYESYADSALFDAPVRLLDTERSDLFLRTVEQRQLSVGSDILDEAYTLGVRVDKPTTLPLEAGVHNTRTFFAPAHIGEVYGVDEVLKVDEIFQDIASRTVEDMYTGASDPLGISLNRFNYEFLSGQTAVPGAQ